MLQFLVISFVVDIYFSHPNEGMTIIMYRKRLNDVFENLRKIVSLKKAIKCKTLL